MFSVNQYRTPLINDLYDLVNFNTSIESLADDICEVCKAFYHQGREEAIDDAEKRLRYLWDRYEADKENVPKPQFTDAIALVTMLELDEEENSNE